MTGLALDPAETVVLETGAGLAYRRRQRRKWLALVAGFVILSASIAVDVATGPGAFPLSTVMNALLEPGSQGAKIAMVIWDIRLPVALAALLVGAMLALAGVQMQTILDNPLAEPFTLGISAAASFGAAISIIGGASILPPVASSIVVTVNAFIMALLASLALLVLARWRGARSETMILFGIAMMFSFNALLALLEYGATETKLQQIVFWMMGSLQRSSWPKLATCAVILLIGIVWTTRRGWALTALKMGDARAASLGVAVQRVRLEALVVVSLLAATAVSFVGTVAFIGLVGPHVARMLVGEDQRFLTPLSMAVGALLLSLTSIISKSITPGVIYPIGIISSLIGIPFFLALICSRKPGAVA